MFGYLQDMPARIDDSSLFKERYVAALAANRPSIGIDDLLRENILLERADCDVTPKNQSYFPEKPPHLSHCSGHDLHLQHIAAVGFGVILVPERMPRFRRSRPFRSKATGFRGRRVAGCARAPLLAGAGRFRQSRAGVATGRSKSRRGMPQATIREV